MTQFVLIKSDIVNHNLKPVQETKNDFLINISSIIYPKDHIKKIFVLNVNEKDIDQLMTEAQLLIFKKVLFENTDLYKVLINLQEVIGEIVFWYGSDYEGVDRIQSYDQLILCLKDSLKYSMCEFYARCPVHRSK